jgi:hypothetical protein
MLTESSVTAPGFGTTWLSFLHENDLSNRHFLMHCPRMCAYRHNLANQLYLLHVIGPHFSALHAWRLFPCVIGMIHVDVVLVKSDMNSGRVRTSDEFTCAMYRPPEPNAITNILLISQPLSKHPGHSLRRILRRYRYRCGVDRVLRSASTTQRTPTTHSPSANLHECPKVFP